MVVILLRYQARITSITTWVLEELLDGIFWENYHKVTYINIGYLMIVINLVIVLKVVKAIVNNSVGK